MFSNVSLLWAVGEITGDLTTGTVVRSLDVPQEAYGLYLVLPSLMLVAHTVTLPAVFGVAPGKGVRFWNQVWMVSTTYYDLKISGAFPRSTLFVNEDTAVFLRQLQFPELRDGDTYAYVHTAVEKCTVGGAGDGDTLHCRVAVESDVYDASDGGTVASAALMDACGGGVVVDLCLAHGTTSDDAAEAVVSGNFSGVSPVNGFPLSVAANSVLRLASLLEAVPSAGQFLRDAAAAGATSSSHDAADARLAEAAPTARAEDWVVMRFSFLYQNRRSGSYQVHCDGSVEDMYVSIRPYDDPFTPVHAHCIQPLADNSTSVFRHSVIDTVFDSENVLYINASCTFRLATLLDANATSAAFCGVSLEGIDVDFELVGGAPLSSHAVYEVRIPLDGAASSSSGVPGAPSVAYQATLSVDGEAAPIAVVDLPSLSSPADCYGLPWKIVEGVAAHPESALYGQRWGGLGYAHYTFIISASSGARYCHTFIAFHLTPDHASSCGQMKLNVTDVRTGAVDDVVLTQRVFCGSRSYFMDPISALQLRVPLIEVPRLVDLNALVPDTETGYMVYQYCVDVLFYLDDADGAAGAYAQNGPLIFTLLDTVDTPSSFVPWVRQAVPDPTTSLVLGDTLFFTGGALRYYDSTGAHPLTGTRFAVQLAAVDVEPCGDFYLVAPSGFFPELPARWINETTIALPITADVPGGWFNLTMTQGEAGEVYVYCGLSFRVSGSITSVTTADVAGPAGGTKVHIRGVNLPMAPPGTNVSLTLGYTRGNAQLRARRCTITFALSTAITCTTPRMSADVIAQLALFTEESEYAYTYWLPVNLTSYFYNGTSGAWEVFQSINVDTVGDGAELLSVKFRVSKATVTDVWPLDVSRMEGNPTFHIRGTGIESHSVLLCDVATIGTASTPEETSCILCLPRSFSAVGLVCDALWPLNERAYRVYVSEIALEGDTGFTVQTHLSVSSAQPDFIYPYAAGVELTLKGTWFASAVTTDMLLVAKANGGAEQRQYHAPFTFFTNTSISALAPDLSWMAERGGTLSLHVVYGVDQKDLAAVCTRCAIKVVSEAMMPSIDSIDPFSGQAPMLIRVYGSGFTQLVHSPKNPLAVARSSFVTGAGTPLGAVRAEEEGEEEQKETYIKIGADPCWIVDMLNTLIVCFLAEPCSNLDPDSTVRLVSRTFGSTGSTAAGTSSKLFFYCTMSLIDISHNVGSIAGGQELIITGLGFPTKAAQLSVTVAGAPCIVLNVTKTAITCLTSASPSGRGSTGVVVVNSRANGRDSSCCSYTYDPDITPTLTSVSPTVAAPGARLLLFGTNFPFNDALPYRTSNASASAGKMSVIFGYQMLEVTDIQSSTRASMTIPSDLFGRDYLSVHVPQIGNSAKYLARMFTVLMTPSMIVPSVGGFRGRTPVRFIGKAVSANQSAIKTRALLDVFVCGRRCIILDASEAGEVRCLTPEYMDEEFVAQYRASLSFPEVTSGFKLYVSSRSTVETATGIETASPSATTGWVDVTTFLAVGAADSYVGFTPNVISFIRIASPEVSILLEARLHSRLLLYNVMLFLVPSTPGIGQLDLSNAICRLHLSTAEAETFDLFSAAADPANASTWQENSSGESSYFTWPSLQVGANSLNFNALGTLPTAGYVRITCEGLPVSALELHNLTVNGYQVGPDATGGRCPVNIVAHHRRDQPGLSSCSSRTGESCPLFYYQASLTPVVTRYEPAYALASNVGARITLHGTGFGDDLSAVHTVLLDKALCTPVSVTDGELVCAMEGRVSRDAEWQVLWTNESGRGEAMLLSAQPFYAAVAWSSYLAWRGEGLPKEGQIVVIPRSNTILLDTTPPALTGMLLYGVLIISDELDIELRLGLLTISETGALIAGSAERPHTHSFTITLSTNVFQESPLFYIDDIHSISHQKEPYLDKTLEVLGGTLQLHGVPPTIATARLAVSASAGDVVVTVDRWVPWSVGDTVALVTKGDPNPHHVEKRVIAQRTANATHTVLRFSSDAPLANRHIGKDEMLSRWQGSGSSGTAGRAGEGWSAEEYASAVGTDVVYLTRTICIRGDAISAVSAVGGALWLINTTTSQLSHVEMYRTGKRGSTQTYSVWLQGIRYPADWVVFNDVVIYDAYYRGVVLQETRHVVLYQVTVLYADGFAVSSIGASDESATVQNSFFVGLYGGSGGADTVPAGLFTSSADVALRSSEICVCDGHGVWFALRFIFLSTGGRTCPGQRALAAIEENRIHHTGGHGLVVYPLQFNTGDRCLLGADGAASNDPASVNKAEMLASVEYTPGMLPAGTLQRQVIFSCGLYGVYLPPSSGYVLDDIVIMDCALASIFVDYATNMTVMRDTSFLATLPDGTCSARSETDEGGAAECRLAQRTGLHAQHGGHLSLSSLALGDFGGGSALRLATLSAPSSQATTYPRGSFAALRSAHLTVLFFNLSVVDGVDLKMMLAGDVALVDTDGQVSHSNVTSFFFFGGATVRVMPPNCVVFSAAEDGIDGAVHSAARPDSADTHAGAGEASTAPTTLSAMIGSGILVEESPNPSLSRVHGHDKTVAGMSGGVVVTLRSSGGNDNNGRAEEDKQRPRRDSFSRMVGNGVFNEKFRAPPKLTVCVAPSKRLSLLFVNVSGVDASAEPSKAVRCTTATAELREGDNTRFLIDAYMSQLSFRSNSTKASAVAFYTLTEDDGATQSDAASGVHAVWHSAVESTNTTWGKAGYYTLESSTNLTLAFRTAAGGQCYPSALSISVDPSLTWPTAALMVQVRVLPSASYFERQAFLNSSCSPSPLVGCITWANASIVDTVSITDKKDVSSAPDLVAVVRTTSSSSLPPPAFPATFTALMSLVHHPLCLNSAASATGSAAAKTARGPWDASPSLWAAVDVTSYGSNDDGEGVGYSGPYFPQMRPLVTSNSTTAADESDASSLFVSWYSAAAWADGVAPWNVNFSGTASAAAESAWHHDAYVIPFGTRVNLTLAEAAQVDGVLVVVGELFIAPAAAATTTSRARASAADTSSSAARDSCLRLSITTLIVLGKLNVSVVDTSGPRVCLVFGAGSASPKPYRLDANTLVYPGTLYAAGEVAVMGATAAPTVWRTTAMVRRNTTAFPTCTSIANLLQLQDWCELHARWAVGAYIYHNASAEELAENYVDDVVAELHVATEQCLATVRDFLPSWMQWTPNPVIADAPAELLVSWRRRDRVGLTSGSSSLNEAEEGTFAQDVNGSYVRSRISGADIKAVANVTTVSVDNGAVLSDWTWSHGREYSRDETSRLPGYGVNSEVVSLTKTVELDCAVPRRIRGRGCMILITRQRHPHLLFEPPRFRASGVSVRHFGKGGQLRGGVAAVEGVEPLTFLPAMYVNITAVPGERVTNQTVMDTLGYAMLSGSVIERSYGTALYTDRRNTHLFMVDSAVWYSEGGGVRLDGGGTGIYMESVVVAGTRYARVAVSSDAGDELPRWRERPDNHDAALMLTDTEVTSMCSVLLNHSHTYYPLQLTSSFLQERVLDTTVVMAASGVFIKNVVAGGSESEGFCLPWAGSGGPVFIESNAAHSSHVGLFLFCAPPAAGTELYEAFFPWSWSGGRDGRQELPMGKGTPYTTSGLASATTRNTDADTTASKGWLTDVHLQNVTDFAQWVIYDNRYIGVYSSGHQNVSVVHSDIFSNPIGVALAVHPMELSGSSQVRNSYVATFPRCSCTAAMYGLTTFDRSDEDNASWHVCQPSAYMEPAWTPKGCGAVTFIDDSYHYTAVLVLPSYAYVPLSYSRDTVFTAPDGGVLESSTEGTLLFDEVLFGAVGELNLCDSTVCEATVMHGTGNVLRSAAVMGTTGESLRSSASLSSIEASRIEYAPSCAQALVHSPILSAKRPMASNRNMDHHDNDDISSRSVANTLLSVYRPLSGTTASVLRLRPTTTAADNPSSAAAAATLADLAQHIRDYCANGNLCDASDSATVATLQEAYASPYVMTAVYDADATLFNGLGPKQIYVPLGATLGSPFSQLLASRCVLSTLAEGNLFACDFDEMFYQVRLRSVDDRVSKGAAVPFLFTRTSLSVADTTATGLTDAADESGDGTTNSVAVLQPFGHRSSGSSNASALSTINDATFFSSASQLAMQVPLGIVTVNINPLSYPEALELHTTACPTPSRIANVSSLLKIRLMDESVTVHVWLVRTRAMLENVHLVESTATMYSSTVSAAHEMEEYVSVDRPQWVEQTTVSDEYTLWARNTMQSHDNGVTVSSLLFRLSCGERLRIHQLVYATLVLYTTGNADAVAQHMLRYGTTLTVRQLLPPQRYPDVDTDYYAGRVSISFFSLAPDAITGEGMMLTIRAVATDSFDYNVTAATLLVTEFSNLFSAAYSRPVRSGESEAVGVQDGAHNSLRSNGLPNRDANTPFGPLVNLLDIAGVLFRVLVVMPPQLPSERDALQAVLSKVNIMKRGQVAEGPLTTLTTVVSVVFVLAAVFAIVLYALPMLQHRKAPTADARRRAASTMDVSAATLVVERAPSNGAVCATAVVVWVAGALRTTLGATLDKAGVTRSAAETMQALHGTDSSIRTLSKELGTHHHIRKRVDKQSKDAAPAKVVRQLFLLPSYNVLSGTSICGPAAAPISAFITHARSERPVARFSDPQRSQEADRQRYVDEWRLGTRAMSFLVQRGTSMNSGGTAGGGLSNSTMYGGATASTSSYATRVPAGRDGGRSSGAATGGDFVSPVLSSVLSTNASCRSAQQQQQQPWLRSAFERAATPAFSLLSSRALSPSPASADAAMTTLERVIPVGMPPDSVPRFSTPLGVPKDLSAKDGGFQPFSTGSDSTITIAPTFTGLPPLPPVSSDPIGAAAASARATPLLTVSAASPSPTDTAAVSPHMPGVTPVAIQSILTTSILAGATSLAYPSRLLHIIGTAPDVPLSAVGSGVVAGDGRPEESVVAATTSTLGIFPGAASDDVPLVLRGRGNIMFTTPDTDVEATRALRGVGSVTLPLNSRIVGEENGLAFDSED
ncbi:putative transmembrane protein [Leptomonas pyrrhocoris]|uniref:Putative transmembrane protein n=1 Tax=Leptomonas pyrrhocoris TaxID=157538 RepID=A0A0N0E089_LEPPY|nr:putative transmembrane protein [Leptomonas pyrrhocoris]KPA86165.1 putative transmembrane protein [Leptomonas pyrrhocoris]|eukprot:XP_015664604.1 putative transmembrane protein [Leptomonas pyrrhocoris]